MQAIKLDVNKFVGAKFFKSKEGIDHIAIPLDPNNIFRGDKGLYLNLTLMDNKGGEDQWGWEGFVTVDLGKDRRMAGEKSPILGNYKTIGQRPAAQNTAPPPSYTADALDEGDDIPF
jgi:hypothetical protein